MKKLTLVATIIASTFAASANAATETATVNITGTITPSSCTINSGANGGTIDFGKIRAASLYQGNTVLHQKGALTVQCDTPTTALIKVSSNGDKNIIDTIRGDTAITYKTDKEFADYAITVENITVEGGTASNSILVAKDANNDNIRIRDIPDNTFKTINKANFPQHGSYFAAASSSDATNIGTFNNLTANYDVTAVIHGEKAREALSGGEQTFTGVVTFELEYI
ncbi:fimbrial protein [Escherichia marmotae]|uniref:fimbrial protein n=1 Tax=Escherichia marmotae TaxID=1499973 RepID=UPI002F31B874